MHKRHGHSEIIDTTSKLLTVHDIYIYYSRCLLIHISMYLNLAPKEGSLVPRLPHPTDERRSRTVASNSWSKRQTSFPFKNDVRYNEVPF